MISMVKCPNCGSAQACVEVSSSSLTARLVCKSCGYKGPKYKASCKEDIELACELVERSAMTFIDDGKESPDSVALDKTFDAISSAVCETLVELCNGKACHECMLWRDSEKKCILVEQFGITCYDRNVIDIKDAFVRRYADELSSAVIDLDGS